LERARRRTLSRAERRVKCGTIYSSDQEANEPR
jgi:hypothetical protein